MSIGVEKNWGYPQHIVDSPFLFSAEGGSAFGTTKNWFEN